MIQQRLDALSQRIRWERRDGNYAAGNGGYNNGGYNNGGYNDSGYYAGNDPRFRTQYDASRYYRDGPNYSERQLAAQDEVYRGSDGRYYCRRRDGTIDNLEIIKDLPYGLGDEARRAVSRWRFRPATYRGEPIDVYYTVTVNFKLQ